MKTPKLKFQKYIASKSEECLELFELNCPAYFAEEERKGYRKFLEYNKDIYLLGYENDSLACCFGITEQLYSSTLLRKVSLVRPRKDGGNLISVVLWSLKRYF